MRRCGAAVTPGFVNHEAWPRAKQFSSRVANSDGRWEAVAIALAGAFEDESKPPADVVNKITE